MAEAAKHGNGGAVERRLETLPVGIVTEARRLLARGVGNAVVGRDDGVAVEHVGVAANLEHRSVLTATRNAASRSPSARRAGCTGTPPRRTARYIAAGDALIEEVDRPGAHAVILHQRSLPQLALGEDAEPHRLVCLAPCREARLGIVARGAVVEPVMGDAAGLPRRMLAVGVGKLRQMARGKGPAGGKAAAAAVGDERRERGPRWGLRRHEPLMPAQLQPALDLAERGRAVLRRGRRQARQDEAPKRQ